MYVIRGFYHDSICYYVDSKIDETTGLVVRTFTATVETATRFKSKKKAQTVCDDLHEKFFKVFSLCPICHKEIIGYPALSRKDNKTKICSTCGVNQALVDLFSYQENGGDYYDE